jgi:hypothetical protein
MGKQISSLTQVDVLTHPHDSSTITTLTSKNEIEHRAISKNR